DIFGHPSAGQIFFQAVTAYLPTKALEWMCEYGSNAWLQRLRQMNKVGSDVAKELVQEKAGTLLQGKGRR
ncbi:hypothetical protein PAXINDRAFT_46577, partial [Paxillus involutus ATCC 200175]